MLSFPVARHRAKMLALCLPLVMTGAACVAALMSARPAFAQEGVEQASQSRLARIPLNGALRVTDAAQLAEIRKQLDAMATQLGGKRVADETLLWTKPDVTHIMDSVAEEMKKAGFDYQTQDGPKSESGATTIVVAVRQAKNEMLSGFWVKNDQLLILSWCRIEKAGTGAATETPPAKDPTTAPPAPTASDTSAVVVPGNPPLTRQMLDHTSHFLAFLLETPLTVEQREKVDQSLITDWKQKDKTTIETVQQMVALRAQIFQKTEAERDLIRKQIQPTFLNGLRAQKSDPAAKWILNIYETAHKPLAPGKPPLTRQMTDAYTEVLYFMASEGTGKTITADAASKNAMAKGLAANYAKAPADFKKTLSQMPLLWSAIRVAWPQMPEEQKQAYRAKWRNDLQQMVAAQQAAPQKTQTNIASSSAPPKSSGTPPSSGKSSRSSKSYASMMAASQAQHQAFMQMSNMSMQMHYSRMNAINTMGGNPYRYVNSYGNPY